MTNGSQPSPRSHEEIRIFAPWAFYLFAAFFVTLSFLFVFVLGLDHRAPSLLVRCLLALMIGTVGGCYAVLIGYINQDSGRRGMSRFWWTLLAVMVPNGLGIVLYFVLRKPRTSNCPQCGADVQPGFSFCPSCRASLKPACPHCQRTVDFGDKFCPYCGGTVAPSVAPPSTTAASQR